MGEAYPSSMELKQATKTAFEAHGAAVNEAFQGGGLTIEGYNAGLTEEKVCRVLEAVHGDVYCPEPSEVGDRVWQVAWE